MPMSRVYSRTRKKEKKKFDWDFVVILTIELILMYFLFSGYFG